MLFFADTAKVDDLETLADIGLLDGVTTNPSLILKSGGNMTEAIAGLCRLTPGPVSAEVVASDAAGMLREAERLAAIAENLCIKLPLTRAGLDQFSRDWTKTGQSIV